MDIVEFIRLSIVDRDKHEESFMKLQIVKEDIQFIVDKVREYDGFIEDLKAK